MLNTKNIIPDKKTLLLLGLFLLSILLINPLKDKFDAWLVKPWISQISSNPLNDVIFLLVALTVVIMNIAQLRKKAQVGNDWVLISLFLSICYTFCRLNSSYSYTGLTFYTSLKYADLCMAAVLSIWAIKVLNMLERNSPPKFFDDPFIVDVPIEQIEKDSLNRRSFARRIAEKIQSKPLLDNAGALAIGITGEWGSGKSSFKNLIKNSLYTDNRIIIEFNPWRSSSSEKIIEDFFELLIAKLKVYDQNLSANIYSYAKTLTSIDENIFTKSAQAISDLFETANKNEIYDSINDSIKRINKQIIIFIDDLDRLDNKEITEVLRIIRNTANFNNVVYVVAYDRGYVLEAVKAFNQSNYRAFLEKIFQFEFALPLYPPEITRGHLSDLLKDRMPDFLHKEIEWVIESRAYKGINFTSELIQNHRTAIRLANALIFEVKDIADDVFFYDFYLLQIFKLKYPHVFEALFENSRFFLLSEHVEKDMISRLRKGNERNMDDQELNFKNIAKFISGRDQNHDPEEIDKEPLFHTFLENKSNQLELTENDIFLIKAMVEELFNTSRKMNETNSNSRYKIFARTENFYKYFAFDLMDGEIPAKDFENARRMPYDQYSKSIIDWVQNGKSRIFIDRIYKIESFSNRLEFENQLRALFEIGRGLHKEGNFYEFNYSFFFKILQLPKEMIERGDDLLYPDHNTYKTFLKSMLADSAGAPTFDNRVLSYMLDPSARYPLTCKEAEEIMFANFKRYTQEDHPIDGIFWHLYHQTDVWNEDSYKAENNPLAEPLMIEYYRSHINDCDLGRFITRTSRESNAYYLNPDQRQMAFKDLDDFEEWFRTAPQIDRTSECFKEFSTYYQANKLDYPRGTTWTFNHLTPNER
ncbi:MAG: P-loop NTPase fold protein [Bacteroidota bacterium]